MPGWSYGRIGYKKPCIDSGMTQHFFVSHLRLPRYNLWKLHLNNQYALETPVDLKSYKKIFSLERRVLGTTINYVLDTHYYIMIMIFSYTGNTSMDPTLSLIMANLAGVKQNDLVLDPFVGTGMMSNAAGISCIHALRTNLYL